MPKKVSLLTKVTKTQGIIVAIISAVSVIVVGYWQFAWKPSNVKSTNTIEYIGNVTDLKSKKPITQAKVNFYFENKSVIAYTDDEGIYRFSLEINSSEINGKIKVEASDYPTYERYITIFRGTPSLEDIRLNQDTLQTTKLIKIEYGTPFDKDGYIAYGNFLQILPEEPSANFQFPSFNMGISLPVGNKMYVSVTNISDHLLILNNKLPLDVEYNPSNTKPHLFNLVGGGGGYYRNFVASVNANNTKQTVWATFEEAGTEENASGTPLPPVNQPDFFTLTPGEMEIFVIEILLDKPGEYNLLPGVEYTDGDIATIEWANRPITTIMPTAFIWWRPENGESKIRKLGECDFAYSKNLPKPSPYESHADYVKLVYTCDF